MGNCKMFNSISVESVTSWLDRVLRVTFSPWYVTSNSMVELLNASNEERAKTDVKTVQDRLTTWWVERKLAELAFVGVTVCIPPFSNTLTDSDLLTHYSVLLSLEL